MANPRPRDSPPMSPSRKNQAKKKPSHAPLSTVGTRAGSGTVWNLLLTISLALAVSALTCVLWKTTRADTEIKPLKILQRDFPSSDALAWRKSFPGTIPMILPRLTNVQIVDLDGDQRNELLVCDAARHAVLRYDFSESQWRETVIADTLNTPAHATVVDIEKDGDNDIVVSILGDIFPSDEMVGRVVLLENENGAFTRRTLLDDVYRVADVQAGDLDGDGDVDLSVAVFGYVHGEVLWLEQTEKLRFRDHHLLDRPGAIHAPIADYDKDGDLDILTMSSQDEEELWAIINNGSGQFTNRRLWFTHNFDAGSGGLSTVDLDRDGDLDVLLPLGDNLEHGYAYPQPYHGCLWFENRGNWNFVPHRIAQFGGAYAAAAGDLDGDGDTDVTLVSMSNDWNNPKNASAVWLENDGRQNFRQWKIDSAPVELITVACGDVDRDGRIDIVAGSLHLPSSEVTNRIERIVVWHGETPGRRKSQ